MTNPLEWVEEREITEDAMPHPDCMICQFGSAPFMLDGKPTHTAGIATPEDGKGPTLVRYCGCPTYGPYSGLIDICKILFPKKVTP